jgi:Uma2 family endonuclease
MGETPEHRDNLAHLIEMLRTWFAQDDQTYVSGNSFLYYVPGNRLRHVSPDVFVVRGIPKTPERRRYLVWEEGKAPDLIIELTSPSTYEEDLEDKFTIYRDILHVQEYFLFDPLQECLEPRLQGFRLRKDGSYAPIRRVKGRLPSKVLGLSLEANGWELRLHDPATDQWLPTPEEVQQALNAERQARLAEQQARLEAEAENERLRKEIDQLRRRNKD